MGESCGDNKTCLVHSGNIIRITNLEDQAKDYAANQKAIVEGQHEIRERLAAVESSSKSAHHRLDTQEEQTKAIYEMSVSVRVMSDRIQEIIDLFDKHETRLDTLERAPAEKIKGYVETLFISSLIALGGLLVGLLF